MAALLAALLLLAAADPALPAPIGGQAAWFAADDYPPAALREETEGRVAFALSVDREGAVTACTVMSGSGSTVLDESTCALLRTRAHFTPAHDRRGRAVASEYRSAVVWRLPRDGSSDPVEVSGRSLHMGYTAEISIDAEGNVTGCRMLEQSSGARTDICPAFPNGAHAPRRVLHDGVPVAAKLRIGSTMDIAIAP